MTVSVSGKDSQKQLKKNHLFFFFSHLLFPPLLEKLQHEPTLLSLTQVKGCNGDIVTPNNKRVGLCDDHAKGDIIFLRWFPGNKSGGSFSKEGWYLVRYCKQRAHLEWLGEFRVDLKTQKLQSK